MLIDPSVIAIPLQVSQRVLIALTSISGLILVAAGLSIIFGLMGVINLSHGALMMVGAYMAFTVQDAGLPAWLGLVIAPIAVGLLGILIESSIIKRLYDRPLDTLLATWGIAIILREGIDLVYGTDSKSVDALIGGEISLVGVTYPVYWLFIVLAAVTVLAFSAGVFKYTDIGIMAIAVIEDRQMAAASGINTEWSDRLTFAFGSALAGLSGAIMAPLLSVNSNMGINWLVNSFLVVIVGGVGSFVGTGVGGILVGGLDNLFRTLSDFTSLAQAVVLLVAFVVIRFRPNGLIPAQKGGE